MHEILRSGSAPNFVYTTTAGKRVTSAAILAYIKSLGIPPAYSDVHIYVSMKGSEPCEPVKQTYIGIDTAGRRQYGYSSSWVSRASKSKFKDLIEFGIALPRIRATVAELLRDPNASRAPTMDIVIALIIRLVLNCYFRLGHHKYKKLYKSYGVSTLEVRHLKFIAPTTTSRIKVPVAKISFIGKKGVPNDCLVSDPAMIAHLANMVAGKAPRDQVFSTAEGVEVRAADVNTWIARFGVDLSSKMFRTFSSSVMLIEQMNMHARRNKKIELPESLSATERKKTMNHVLDIVSDTVHNTRAVCRKSYVFPELVDLYLLHPRKYATMFMRDGIDPEKAFLEFLKAKVKVSAQESKESTGGDPDSFWNDF